MTAQTSTLIILCGWAVGLSVWIFALSRAWRIMAASRKTAVGAAPFADAGAPAGGYETIVPPFRVKGRQEEILKEIGKALSGGGVPLVGQFVVSNVGFDHVEFGARAMPGTGMGLVSSVKGVFRAKSCGWEETEVAAEADFSAVNRKAGRISFLVTFLLGVPFAVVLPAVLLAFVPNHPNPNVRVQAVQVVQMIHGLWPPFLVMHLLHSRVRKMIVMGVEGIAGKLRFVG